METILAAAAGRFKMTSRTHTWFSASQRHICSRFGHTLDQGVAQVKNTLRPGSAAPNLRTTPNWPRVDVCLGNPQQEFDMFKLNFLAIAVALSVLPLAAGAATTSYTFNLNAAQQVPQNPSPAAGSFQMMLDDVADTITFSSASFGFLGTVTASHIHMAPAGVNGAVVYNLLTNADSMGPLMIGAFALPGSYGFTGAGKAIAASLISDINAAPWNFYVNIHTSAYGGGEIRGQLAPVPEPSTYALMAIGLGLLTVAKRRRKSA